MMKRLLGLFGRGKQIAEATQQAKKGSKKKWLIGGGIAGLLGGSYLVGRFAGDGDEGTRDEGTKDQQNQQNQQPEQPKQLQSKPTQHQTQQNVIADLDKKLNQEDKKDEPIVGAFIPELIKLYQLSNALSLQYEQDANAFYQIYQIYEKKLEELIPIISVELAKTPLSQMTGADLPSKISTLFKYYPWDFAINNFPKILKGYYLVKMYNEDTTNLTINDLIAVADNPALAQNENVIRIFEQIGELYKLKMQSALEQIGKLKDIYSYKLNILKEQANFIKNMVNAILDQEELNFKKWLGREQIRLKEKQLAIDSEYKRAKIAQGWENLRIKREQLRQKLSGNTPQIKIDDEE